MFDLSEDFGTSVLELLEKLFQFILVSGNADVYLPKLHIVWN